MALFYYTNDTFLRHTCEKHDDKASLIAPGACSPFIQQRVMKTDVLGFKWQPRKANI